MAIIDKKNRGLSHFFKLHSYYRRSRMPDMYIIMKMVGFGLLLLGCASGMVLFIKTFRGINDSSVSTLWGLFVIGMVSGLIILSSLYKMGVTR